MAEKQKKCFHCGAIVNEMEPVCSNCLEEKFVGIDDKTKPELDKPMTKKEKKEEEKKEKKAKKEAEKKEGKKSASKKKDKE